MNDNFRPTRTFVSNFGLMLKTHRRDSVMAKNLLQSITKFNRDHIPVYLLAPESDFEFFKSFIASGEVLFVPEESIQESIFSVAELGNQAGYMNQQIYKLGFASLGLAKSYLCLDSDAAFVRDFFIHDFIDQPSQIPFTFMLSDAELMAEDAYYHSVFVPRSEDIQKIYEAVGLPPGAQFMTIHGFQILQSELLDEMESTLFPRLAIGNFKEMLEIVGYEFNWYTQWARVSEIPFLSREPVFKTFHSGREFVRSLYFRMGSEQYGRGYVGVCINSNFQHGRGHRAPLTLSSNTSITSGIYLSFTENLRLLAYSLGAVAVSLVFQFARAGLNFWKICCRKVGALKSLSSKESTF